MDADDSADPEDELLGAVAGTSSEQGSVATVASRLRPARTPNFIGSYAQFLRDLPDLVAETDLDELLEATAVLEFDYRDHTFSALVPRLLVRAWDRGDRGHDERIARLLVRMGSPDRASLHRGEGMLPWQRPGADADRRRRLALEVSRLDPKRGRWTAHRFGLLEAADGVWFLDKIVELPESEQPAAAQLAHLVVSNPADAATADKVLSLPADHPAYDELAPLRGGCSTESETAREYRDLASEGRQTTAEAVAEWRQGFDTLLARSADTADEWWLTATALGDRLNDQDVEVLTVPDFRSRPAWNVLTVAEQDAFLRQGVSYLSEHDPRPEATSTSPITWDSFKDWNGVYLLYTLARLASGTPPDEATGIYLEPVDLLATVPEEVWVKWAPSIVRIPRFGAQPDWPTAIFHAAPPQAQSAMTATFLTLVTEDASSDGLGHPFAAYAGADYVSAVRTVVAAGERPDKHREIALAALQRISPEDAVKAATEVTHAHTSFAPAWRTIARLSPDRFAEAWLSGKVTPGGGDLGALDVTRIDPTYLPQLATKILDTCSFESDANLTPDERATSDPARRLRHGLLEQMAEHGLTAAMEHLAKGRPEDDRFAIAHFLTRGRRREAELKHRVLPPGTFMTLLESADARLVRDDASLTSVIVEQLDHIAGDIPLGAFRDVWNGHPGTEGGTLKAEDDISDYLQRQLRLRLSPHVAIDREIQVSRTKATGTGQRMDIIATVTGGGPTVGRDHRSQADLHRDLMTALDDQLVSQYLEP